MTKALGFLLLFLLTNASLFMLFPLGLVRFLVVAVVYASGTAVMLTLLFHPGSRWLVDVQDAVECRGRRCVALTFDDGPSPEVTPSVLAILREKNVKATFFLIGAQVDRHPEVARLIRSEGHVLGNHTYSHPPLFCFLTPHRLREEIELAQQAIHRTTGVAPRHFRSPVGLRHPLLGPALDRAGLTMVLWRIRTYDTRARTSGQLQRRILDRVQPGAIVLLHDRPGPASSAMLAALPDIIEGLRAQKYEFTSLAIERAGSPGDNERLSDAGRPS